MYKMYIPKGKGEVEKESLEMVTYKGGLLIREMMVMFIC